MGDLFLLVWSLLGLSQVGRGGFIQLEGFRCGQKEGKDLELYSLYVFFGQVWKERNCIAFREGSLVV